MNNSRTQVEIEINIKDVIWDLLEQWKAILIVALLMALLVSGAKFIKDSRSFSAQEDAIDSEKQSELSAEERIEEILSALPEDERLTTEYLVKQNEWLAAEKEYVSKSIYFNTDPTNQRALILDYYIEETDDSKSIVNALAYGYAGFIDNEKVIAALGPIIDSEAEEKYIAELISCRNKTIYNLVASNDESTIIEIKIVLPDEADAQAVETAFTDTLKSYSVELSKSVGTHTIKLVESGVTYLYNNDAVSARNNVLYSIYNLTNYNKNLQSTLSDGQKSAVEQIMGIKKEESAESKPTNSVTDEESNNSSADVTKRPRFSKKYALLGFILGTMAYAFGYLLLIILRGRVNSAREVEHYTQTRLLGEIYYEVEKCIGIKRLLRSKIVEKFRYSGVGDSKEQTGKLIESLTAVSKHAGTKEVDILNFANRKDDFASSINNMNIKINLLDATVLSEGKIMDIKNAILTVDKKTKVLDLLKTVSLCREYGVKVLGCAFIGER